MSQPGLLDDELFAYPLEPSHLVYESLHDDNGDHGKKLLVFLDGIHLEDHEALREQVDVGPGVQKEVVASALVILPQGDEHVVDVEILAADPDLPLLQLAAVVVPQVLVETVKTRHDIPVGADTLDIGVHGTAQLAALGLRDLVVLGFPECQQQRLDAVLLLHDIIDLLKELNSKKPVWVELGLQTIHEKTARFIRRGYELPVFEDALKRLKKAGITVIVHVILGLPGETTDQMKETVTYLADRPIDGIKLQLLHILKGTDLADVYQTDPFHVFSIEEYIDLVIDCITLLPPRITIHRMTGDGPKNLLIAPLWSGNKRLVLNQLHKRFKERGAWQGQCYVSPLIPAALPFRHPQW